MRSRAVRLTLCALAWLALGTAAFFIFQSEQRISERRALLRAYDIHAREALDALADMRAGQQAYVAEGQGVEFWMPKVSALTETATAAVELLRASAVSSGERGTLQALVDAANTIAEFGNVDKRARDYIYADQSLMASDVVFTEGGETVRSATRQVEAASMAEHQALDRFEAAQRKLEMYAASGAGALGGVILLLLAIGSTGAATSAPVESAASPTGSIGLALRDVPAASSRSSERSHGAELTLKAAADLCTEFGRLKDVADLTRVLGETANLMEASGLIVWLANSAGGDLRPVIAHGYPPQTLARMPLVPRTADNAAAAAYRTGSLQIVIAHPGTADGAIVAPLLSPDGCIGALTAEIKGGGETSDRVQSLAAMFAAQLTGVLSGSLPASFEASSEQRIAHS